MDAKVLDIFYKTILILGVGKESNMSLNEKSYDEIIEEEESKHNCCNGYVYYDGRCGDGPIFIHEKACRVGKQEERERKYWDRERR